MALKATEGQDWLKLNHLEVTTKTNWLQNVLCILESIKMHKSCTKIYDMAQVFYLFRAEGLDITIFFL